MEFDALHHEAQLAFDQADYGRAIALSEQGYTAQPDRLEWAWYLGAALLLNGSADEGQAVWFAAVAELDPSDMDDAQGDLLRVLTALGERQHRGGQGWAAACLYEAVLELAGDTPEVHLAFGTLQAERGYYDSAIAHWQTVTQLDPTLTAADLARAKVHQKLGEWEAASAAYQAVVRAHPTHAIAWYNLGLCYLHHGLAEQAYEAFTRALEHQPEDSRIVGDLAYTLFRLGNVDAALSTLQALSRHEMVSVYQQADPDLTLDRTQFLSSLGSAKCLLPLGRLLVSAQDWGVAQTVAAAAIAQFPDHAEAKALTAAVQPPAPPLWQPVVASVAAPHRAVLSAEAGVAYEPIHPPSVVKLRSPKTVDSAAHYSFRFDGAVPLPGSFVATLSNGRFWLNADQSSCVVLTEDNLLLSDLSPEFPILSPGSPVRSHGLLSALPPCRAINATVVVLAGLSNDVYFHWLCDIVPRAELLHQSGIDWSEVDFVLVSDRQTFQRELLKQLGLPPDKLLSLQTNLHIQADRLIVPSFSGTVAWMSPAAAEFVRRLVPVERFSQRDAEPSPDLPKRLYLSRQATTNRRILNAGPVEELLQRRGFVSLTLEGYSVQEQAALLANAESVVAPHGSGLTNLLFCSPGARVIELFSPNYVYPCYWYLANLVGLDYYYGVGQQPEGESLHRLLYPNSRLEDIWVNLAELSALLDMANVM